MSKPREHPRKILKKILQNFSLIWKKNSSLVILYRDPKLKKSFTAKLNNLIIYYFNYLNENMFKIWGLAMPWFSSI